MELIVKVLDEASIGDMGKIDGRFSIDSQLVLHAEANQIRYDGCLAMRLLSFRARSGR